MTSFLDFNGEIQRDQKLFVFNWHLKNNFQGNAKKIYLRELWYKKTFEVTKWVNIPVLIIFISTFAFPEIYQFADQITKSLSNAQNE